MSKILAAIPNIRDPLAVPAMLSAVLLVAIALQLILFVRGATTNFGVQNQRTTGATSLTIHTPHAASADLALMGRLFGSAAAEGAAPDSASQLILTGTFVWGDERSGMAIVGETKENSSLFRVGAELPGGLILTGVFVDRIVVSRHGAPEIIRFAPRTPGEAGAGDAPLIAPETAQPANSVLGGFARVVPVKQGSNVAGYKVYPTDDTNALSEMGLRAGDLIVAINGTRLNDPKVAPGLVATLSWASGVAVTVKRGGRERDLVLSTERAAANAMQQRQIQEQASLAKDPVTRTGKPRRVVTEAAASEQ